ncbi:MAG: hypothetical protein ACLFO5_03900 [Opitutales bacterium]
MPDTAYDLERNVHRITLYSTVERKHRHPGNFKPRLYLHIDMNCFYAQVEQQCYNLYGMPVIVGGWRKEDGRPRGIVATSSYEARSYGIKTGMSHYEAVQLCPYVIPLQVHYEKYQAVSREIGRVLENHAPEVERYSMDEYFLNLTHLRSNSRRALAELGAQLKADILSETGLVCSVGIAYSKTYAKLASDLHKPDGLELVLDQEDARNKLWPLPLDEVWGIGTRRYAKLRTLGLNTISDAVARGSGPFEKLFGACFGKMLFDTVTGRDYARVLDEPAPTPREVSYMHTFSDWSRDYDRVLGELALAVRQLCYRMRGYGRKAEKFHGYIRFQDDSWQGVSFRFSTPGATHLDDYVLQACLESADPILRRHLNEGRRIRGVGLGTLEMNDGRQLELFFHEDERLRRLHFTTDAINNRHGPDTLVKASLKHTVEGKTHFLERNAGGNEA